MKTWKATAWQDGKYWIITVEGLDSATQARSVKEIDIMVRDFISILTEQPESAFDVEVDIQLPADVKASLKRAKELQAEADRARKAAAEESRKAARALKANGLTVRDIGAALGISFQRAHQLTKS